jgi:hypothetical protein
MLKLNGLMVRRFYDVALRHQEAAIFLLSGCSPNSRSAQATEVIYLGGYAVECILKALLLSRFRTRRHPSIEKMFVEEVRHNLDLLRKKLTELKKKPVVFPQKMERTLRSVRSLWSPHLRYDAKLTLTEEASDFMNMVDDIVGWSQRAG